MNISTQQPEPAEPPPLSRAHDLRIRMISAAIMIPVALLCLWLGQVPFAVLVTAGAILLLREWVRMVNEVQSVPAVVLGSIAIVIAAIAGIFEHTGVAFAVLCCGALCIAALARHHRIWAAAGVFYGGLPAIALVHLRGLESGVLAVVFLMVVIWMTDMTAYAGGRAIGGPKLWASVSPKKTWAGFISGLAGAGSAGIILRYISGPESAHGATMLFAFLLAMVISVAGQMGDLFESYVKRRNGVKDSGTLIPGHGGAMDRLDSLVTASVVAALIAIAFGLVRTFEPFVWSVAQ
ncbi:phosphatidate cytidylyltransferase [Tepidamorphus sp. 3E244]|uniref:phosphatidate cytidylyltransferase n=1 Tax=Tepidamorphus sp. 3E244 TaxID=3385498 RepID=UPI0038FCDAD6